jgi:hypothetical protein
MVGQVMAKFEEEIVRIQKEQQQQKALVCHC